jgi:hypothetical protein
MKRTINSLIVIIILSLVALFLRRRINKEIEIGPETKEPDLQVVTMNEEEIVEDIIDDKE